MLVPLTESVKCTVPSISRTVLPSKLRTALLKCLLRHGALMVDDKEKPQVQYALLLYEIIINCINK